MRTRLPPASSRHAGERPAVLPARLAATPTAESPSAQKYAGAAAIARYVMASKTLQSLQEVARTHTNYSFSLFFLLCEQLRCAGEQWRGKMMFRLLPAGMPRPVVPPPPRRESERVRARPSCA